MFNTLVHAFAPVVMIPPETLPKRGFWTHQLFHQPLKIVGHAVYLWCARIKVNYRVADQDHTVEDTLIPWLECLNSQLFGEISESSHCFYEEWP